MTSILLASRAVVTVAGADAGAFLQGLVTQDVAAMAPGDAAFAALLTPQGKIVFDFLVFATGDGFLLDVDGAQADALVRRLSLYRLRSKVEIALQPGWSAGVAFGGETPLPAGGAAARDPRLPALGWRVVAPREALTSFREDADEYDRCRLALGVPESGRDFGPDDVFLTDVNYDALNGVSYKKGCFIGQEVTSRMKRKGEIRRRTLIASFDGAAPAKGMAVTAGEATLGEILSGAESMALALIRVDRLAATGGAEAALSAGGTTLRLTFPGWLEAA